MSGVALVDSPVSALALVDCRELKLRHLPSAYLKVRHVGVLHRRTKLSLHFAAISRTLPIRWSVKGHQNPPASGVPHMPMKIAEVEGSFYWYHDGKIFVETFGYTPDQASALIAERHRRTVRTVEAAMRANPDALRGPA